MRQVSKLCCFIITTVLLNCEGLSGAVRCQAIYFGTECRSQLAAPSDLFASIQSTISRTSLSLATARASGTRAARHAHFPHVATQRRGSPTQQRIGPVDGCNHIHFAALSILHPADHENASPSEGRPCILNRHLRQHCVCEEGQELAVYGRRHAARGGVFPVPWLAARKDLSVFSFGGDAMAGTMEVRNCSFLVSRVRCPSFPPPRRRRALSNDVLPISIGLAEAVLEAVVSSFVSEDVVPKNQAV